MVPFPDVIATTVGVVLEGDDRCEVIAGQLRIKSCDLFVKSHGLCGTSEVSLEITSFVQVGSA